MRLILVRHGECEGNAQARSVGREDSPLTALGREQAAKIAKHFARTHIDAIYSSPLSRAYDTALSIAELHRLPVVRDERLFEIDFGTVDMSRQRHHGTRGIIELAEKSDADPFTFTGHGGESLAAALARVRPFLTELLERYRGKTVLVASHSGIMRLMLLELLKLPREDIGTLGHENTAFSILDITENGSWRAHVIGSNEHLK